MFTLQTRLALDMFDLVSYTEAYHCDKWSSGQCSSCVDPKTPVYKCVYLLCVFAYVAGNTSVT